MIKIFHTGIYYRQGGFQQEIKISYQISKSHVLFNSYWNLNSYAKFFYSGRKSLNILQESCFFLLENYFLVGIHILKVNILPNMLVLLITKVVIKSLSHINGLSYNIFEFLETWTSDGRKRTTLALVSLSGTVFKLLVTQKKQFDIEKQKDNSYRNRSYMYDQWSNLP